jgi:hypothetical protein
MLHRGPRLHLKAGGHRHFGSRTYLMNPKHVSLSGPSRAQEDHDYHRSPWSPYSIEMIAARRRWKSEDGTLFRLAPQLPRCRQTLGALCGQLARHGAARVCSNAAPCPYETGSSQTSTFGEARHNQDSLTRKFPCTLESSNTSKKESRSKQ